jgi:hypothetical protein
MITSRIPFFIRVENAGRVASLEPGTTCLMVTQHQVVLVFSLRFTRRRPQEIPPDKALVSQSNAVESRNWQSLTVVAGY